MEKAVFFDLDGTLLDRKRSFARFAEKQLGRFRPRTAGVSVDHWIEKAVELDHNGFTPRPEMFARLVDHFALEPGLGAELEADFQSRFGAECVAFEGAVDTLAALAAGGWRLGLITNGTVAMQVSKVKGLGIARWFGALLISEAEGFRKPAIDIFRRGAERLGVEHSRCVHVGDSPDADVRGARNAGMRAIWVRDEFWEQPDQVDHIVDHVAEVPAVLAAWEASA
jgi:putative hydrolase of the HAD superfamily